jgi:hypothetical protein
MEATSVDGSLVATTINTKGIIYIERDQFPT